MLTSKSVKNCFRFSRTFLVLLFLVQLLAVLIAGTRSARAEGFVSDAFQNQWNATDADVANGKVARTFFWGSQAFAHTAEVYSETVTGTRKVQYFDKGRMELTQRPGSDPNAVTNGLLTVELVSGRLQLGDYTFVQHQPATNPVAGDPSNNDISPTYASFNKGKLAYGVAGAITATDRTNQKVDQSVNKDGIVAGSANLFDGVTYSHYVSATKHNIANVFYNFFLNPPLGNDKWLAVMGLPITEPYWLTATVGGKSQAVLVQLFERRALTYTPNNPTGFQVEMANIGQHYYAWRYGLDLHSDTVPGNYQVIAIQAKTLLSVSVDGTQTRKLVTMNNNIANLWAASTSGLAIIDAGTRTTGAYYTLATLYLVDLVTPDHFTNLPLNMSAKNPIIESVKWSNNGQRAVVVYYATHLNATNDLVYDTTYVKVYDFAGNQLVQTSEPYTSADKYYKVEISPEGRYLALANTTQLTILNLNGQASVKVDISVTTEPNTLQWLNNPTRLLYNYRLADGSQTKLELIDPTTGNRQLISANASATLASPDGNYLAIVETSPNPVGHISSKATLTMYTLANPLVALWKVNIPLSPAELNRVDFKKWAVDSSYLQLDAVNGYDKYDTVSSLLVEPIQGKFIKRFDYYSSSALGAADQQINAPYYLLERYYRYDGYSGTSNSGVVVSNIDGSDSHTILNSTNSSIYLYEAELVRVGCGRFQATR